MSRSMRQERTTPKVKTISKPRDKRVYIPLEAPESLVETFCECGLSECKGCITEDYYRDSRGLSY